MSNHLPVSAFDVLITLYNAPAYRLRTTELATEAILSPSGLTHLVGRLEARHLVEREVDPHDRRGFHGVLTEAGLARLNAARPTHNAVIRGRLTERISQAELRGLGALWQRVLAEDRAREAPPAADSG